MSNLIRSRTSRVSAVLATAALAVGLAAPAAQAQPVVTGGLVNVTVVDAVDVTNNRILQNVGVGVGANVAANVCGVDVNAAVLGAIRNDDSPEQFECTAGDQTVTIDNAQRGG